MATTRLRRTFHYPSDSDDPPDLDEEHQETLLHDLETTDQKTSTLYRKLFLAVPILTVLHSILNINAKHTSSLDQHQPTATQTASSLFLTLLQIAVPILAAWILQYHPITAPAGNHGLMKSLYASSSGKSAQQSETAKFNARFLINLGLGLSAILAITAGAKWSSMTTTAASPEVQAAIRKINGEWSEIGSLLLPAGMSMFYDFGQKLTS
jgi:hypothetical protein